MLHTVVASVEETIVAMIQPSDRPFVVTLVAKLLPVAVRVVAANAPMKA